MNAVVDDFDLIRAFMDEESQPGERTRTTVGERLSMAMAEEKVEPLTPGPGPARSARRSHRRAATVSLLGAVAASAAIVLGVTTFGGSPPVVPTRPGSTVRLADFTAHLPAGYRVASSCPAIPAGTAGGVPLAGNNALAVEASASGGCLRATFEAYLDTPPAGALAFRAGSHQAYVVSDPGTRDAQLYLQIPKPVYMTIPTEAKPLYLLFQATGLTPAQVMAIAKGITVTGTPLPVPLAPAPKGN